MIERDLTPEQLQTLVALAEVYSEAEAAAEKQLDAFKEQQEAELKAKLKELGAPVDEAMLALKRAGAEIAGVDPEIAKAFELDTKHSKLRLHEDSDPCECRSCRMKRAFGELFEGLAKAF